ncbi:MAG TPA: helix-turn-helix domain-containing protein [Candidatus Hydrogenedentes bacterium]|nr:helix-turn-helix domain-containing protein [Candidatus Hydrogenedentota bacterium]
MAMDEMLTVEEVAEILKVRPLTVRQMFRERRLRAFKIGKAWRTTRAWLEQDLAAMSSGGSVAFPPSPENPPARRPARRSRGQRAIGQKSPRESSASAPDAAPPRTENAEVSPSSPEDPVSTEASQPREEDPQQYLF